MYAYLSFVIISFCTGSSPSTEIPTTLPPNQIGEFCVIGHLRIYKLSKFF